MCRLTVDLDDIAAIYGGVFIPNDFAEIDALAEQGTCHRHGNKITVPEANRPLVRLVCGAFDRYLGTGKARHSVAV
jgi:oxygen-independent coproporphyrinogen-3 oxidase